MFSPYMLLIESEQFLSPDSANVYLHFIRLGEWEKKISRTFVGATLISAINMFIRPCQYQRPLSGILLCHNYAYQRLPINSMFTHVHLVKSKLI